MVQFSDEALDDLAAIRADERFGAAQCAAMAKKIVARCRMLDTFPRLGHLGREPGTLELSIWPWVVVCEIAPTGPKVIKIWHGRQNRGKPVPDKDETSDGA